MRAKKSGGTLFVKLGIFVATGMLLAGCVTTSYQTQKTLPKEETRRIVVLPPDVQLSILHMSGVEEPQAEWTAKAQKFIGESLSDQFRTMGLTRVTDVKIGADPLGDPKETQLLKLHEAVGNSILVHQYPGPFQLPTKANNFEWTLGPDTAYLRKKYGADYALFCFVRDSYSSDERVAMMFVGALMGISVQGGIQVGFASLVDLKTGDVVWFNRLLRGTGDLREAKAADETVTQLLANFPQ